MNKHCIYIIAIICIPFFGYGQEIKLDRISNFEKNAHYQNYTFETHNLSSNYNILYHRIHWFVDPSQHFIKGEVCSFIKAKNENTKTIYFDLSSKLRIDSIKQNDTLLHFSHDNNLIAIQLNQALNKNQCDSVTVFYQGRPESTGFGAFTSSSHSGKPILWTLSEPYGAKEWWPCKQSLTDKIDSIDISVTVPKGNKVASNGRLTTTQHTNTTSTYFWQHRHPIATYLVAIAVSNYKEFSDFAKVNDTDSVEILNYVYPESYEKAIVEAKYTVDLIELYSQLLIPYPFYNEKYGHAQFGWGGGMEHQTMSFMGSFNPNLIAHELAHQWFGDHITCGSWQDIWVNEGFAVFGEALAIEYLRSDEWSEWIEERINHVSANAHNGSVFVKDTSNISRVFDNTLTYQKGGMVLHQLRHQIGDEAFFKALQLMLTSNNNKGNFAKTNDVRHYFESAADTNLVGYFDQWIYGEGYPRFTIKIVQTKDFTTTITISQNPTSPKTIFFPLYLPIEFSNDDQRIEKRFFNASNHQQFTFNAGFTINKVVVDPNYQLITQHPSKVIFALDDKIREEKVVLAPNPTNHSVTIYWDTNLVVNKIEIFSTKGKLVYYEPIKSDQAKITIALGKLKTANYIVKVHTQSSVIIKKLIKE